MSKLQNVPKAYYSNIFKTLSELTSNVLHYMGDNFGEVGSTFRASILHRDVIFSKDPEWFQHVAKLNHRNFKKGHVFDKMKAALGNGLLTSDDDLWKRQRKLAQPTFYKKRLEGLMDVMMVKVREFLERWDGYKAAGTTVQLDKEILELTSDIVMATLLGENFKEELHAVDELLLDMQKYVMKLIRIPLFKQYAMLTGEYQNFNKIKKEFNDIIYKIIEARQANGMEHDDLLGMLMAARDAETGEKMSTKQLRDEFITIFVAGHETTAYAIIWSFYLLGKNPAAYKKMKAAAADFDLNGKLDLKAYMQMEYANAVFKEAMRIYPPAYVLSRQARVNDQIQDYKVAKDDAVILSVFHLHRDENYWESPLEFKPERFLNGTSDAERNYYYPFGAGPRMCIGNNFASMEGALILMGLFKHLDYELVDKEVDYAPIITLKQAGGLKVRFVG